VSGKAKTRRIRALVAAAAAVLAAGLLWGIGSALAASESLPPEEGKVVLHLGWTNDPDSLNPFMGYEASSYEVWTLNYELLVGFRASDMANVPGLGLATDWQASDDGKTWTFTITDKSKWQDGKPLTACDVAFTYNYCLKNKMELFIDYLRFIDSVEAPNDTTVVFKCSKAKANMLGLWIPILPEHIWSKVTPEDAEASFKNAPPIVGSGPFQTVEWKRGVYVRMVANKDYWRGAPKIDEVIFETYQNPDTMAQDLRSGALESAWNIPAAQVDALDAKPDLESIRAVTRGFDELGMNCADQKKYPKSTGHPALTDPAFRQALQWAVDKDKLIEIAYGGNSSPADTLIQRDYYAADADYHWTPPAEQAYTFDLEKARQSLDDAGYPDSDGDGIREYRGEPITLRLYSRSESPVSQGCGRLITGWFREIGLDIDYQVIDDNALDGLQFREEGGEYAPDFDMFIWGWYGDVDPNYILSVLTTSAVRGWSDTVWSNEEYDKLFLKQQTTMDLQKRVDIVHRMEQIVYEESPYILLAYTKDLECANKGKWSGWVRANEGEGAWWYNTLPDTYMAVAPTGAEEASDGGPATGLIVAIVAAVAAAAIVVVVLLRRRGGRAEIEG